MKNRNVVALLAILSYVFQNEAALASDNYFPIGGIKYRMAGAHTILTPGAVGELLRSGVNNFSMYTTPDLGAKALFSLATTYSMTNSSFSDIAIALNAEVSGQQIQAALGLAKDQKFSGVFQIYSIANEGRKGIIEALNSSANRETIVHLQKLESPRIVSTVVKVVQFDRDTRKTNSLSVTIPSNVIPNVPVSAGITNLNQKNLQESFSEGTIIAYEVDRIYWTTDSLGQAVVGHLRPDRAGLDALPRPEGMDTDHKKVLGKK